MVSKEILRKIMKEKLRELSSKDRKRRSRIIHKKIFSNKDFLNAKSVMLYVSKGTGEVETGSLIKKAHKMGKEVILPITLVREKKIRPVRLDTEKTPFKKGPYGIYEPALIRKPARGKDIDFVIVPGLAFDTKNNRLGHGKGYYDRFLKALPKDTPKVGLGFRFQKLRKIPTAKGDFPLSGVITE